MKRWLLLIVVLLLISLAMVARTITTNETILKTLARGAGPE